MSRPRAVVFGLGVRPLLSQLTGEGDFVALVEIGASATMVEYLGGLGCTVVRENAMDQVIE